MKPPCSSITIEASKFARGLAMARVNLRKFAIEHGANPDNWRDFYGPRDGDAGDPVYGEFREDGWLGDPDAWKGK